MLEEHFGSTEATRTGAGGVQLFAAVVCDDAVDTLGVEMRAAVLSGQENIEKN